MIGKRLMKIVVGVFLTTLVAISWTASAVAQIKDLPDGSKIDPSAVCPVCNMKADTGSLGPAAIVFNNGKVVAFDGAGDLFRYLFSPEKYGLDPSTIKSLFVTEYGTKQFVDANQAHYVVGSDVTGMMGNEAVPFSRKEDAEKFKTEHHGKAVAAYSEVKPEDVKTRKKILKMDHNHEGGDKSKH